MYKYLSKIPEEVYSILNKKIFEKGNVKISTVIVDYLKAYKTMYITISNVRKYLMNVYNEINDNNEIDVYDVLIRFRFWFEKTMGDIKNYKYPNSKK